MDSIDQVKQIISQFELTGDCIDIAINTSGHINDTFISTFDTPQGIRKYTHQHINGHVFKVPLDVMENIEAVTSHIRMKLRGRYPDISKRCLEIIRTKSGALAYRDDGEYWRTYRYIDGVKVFNVIDDERQAGIFGAAIGTFQLQLSDFPGETLHETIHHFHDMRMRYRQLEEAVANDKANRLTKVEPELAFLLGNRERGYLLWDCMENRDVPIRVTHNDTKINNVLFSQDGNEALCVIDLDTVMPGTILFDTGDMIRTATITGEEDETDLAKITCDERRHKALIQGYFSTAKGFLTRQEKTLVVESGRNITQIMAVRFLTDYLNGDVYYHVDRPDHNLDRAKTQIRLIQEMDRKWDSLNSVYST